jgi:SAM-dependent methyltransferase
VNKLVVHWLEAIKDLASAGPVPAPSSTSSTRCALVVGDAGGKSVALLQQLGYHVVWSLPPHGTTAEYTNLSIKAPNVRLAGEWLPFPDETFDGVVLHETLEFMTDDRRGAEEAARVLKPHAWFMARIPATGRLAWLDAFNIYRYANETLSRGLPLPETLPTGWRRHYGDHDITAVFAHAPLANLQLRPSGGWLTDAVYATALLATGLLSNDPARWTAVRRTYSRGGDLEEHLDLGRYRIVTATKAT